MVKSYSFDQHEIIKDIVKLYIPSGTIDLDPCYSKGVFYNTNLVNQPILKYDLYPQVQGVVQADCRHLPLADSSLDSIMFDPPFLATTGPSLKKNDGSNIINKRFGVYETEKDLHQMYKEALQEFYRLLKPNGILVFKCQDKVSSGKQYMTHMYATLMAEDIGFYTRDMFVLLVKNRIVADWQTKNQQHARKFHSYFIVFQKPKNSRKMSWKQMKEIIR